MRRSLLSSMVLLSACALACADDGGSEASSATSAGQDESSSSTPGDGDGDGDASGDGDGDPAAGDGDGDPPAGDGDAETSGDGDGESSGDGDGESSGGEGIKWDIGAPDVPPDCSGGGGGDALQSMIWIANSAQGTVSKIDTQTMTELGRYWVRPDQAGSPSRTSVSTSGDMVVGARHGGVTKIYFDQDNCVESNGVPGIQTSTGPNDVLAWDQEECRAWHTPMVYNSIRAVAWTTGVWNQGSCSWEGAEVWVSGDQGVDGSAEVMRLDGETGEIVEMISLPDMTMSLNVGAYGAVVDEGGNLWLAQIYARDLTRIDYQTLDVQTWIEPIHTYGIAYHEGLIYLCNREVARFDPDTETFDVEMIEDWNGFYGHTGGCMVDGQGRLWKGIDDTLYAVDTDSLQIVDQVAMPEGMQWGVAIDFDGYVWTIPRNGSTAYRVDPADHSIESVGGLVGAYTYSDMTGFMLSGVAAG